MPWSGKTYAESFDKLEVTAGNGQEGKLVGSCLPTQRPKQITYNAGESTRSTNKTKEESKRYEELRATRLKRKGGKQILFQRLTLKVGREYRARAKEKSKLTGVQSELTRTRRRT
jgi:hypothetical protein